MRHLRQSILFLLLLTLVVGGRGLMARRLGTISGTVTESGGPAIAGAQVRFYNELGVEQLPFATTLADGTYTKSLAPGTYYVRTSNTPLHVDEVHSNILCVNFCDPTDGTPVFLADLATATIDFALDKGTSISGTVTGTGGAGLVGVTVNVVDAGNQTVASMNTIAGGVWTTSSDIPAGSYFIRTFISSLAPAGVLGYVPELYDNIPCLLTPCNLASGTQVTTTVAVPATGVTLALDEGGYFEGTVTSDGLSGQAGVIVDVLNLAGQRVAFSGQTTASGVFRTVPGLPPGAYVLRTQNNAGRINAFNDGSLCVGNFCTVTNETPIQVLGAGAIAGVDFTLPAGAQIVGTLLGNGAANPSLTLSVLNSSGASITFANVDGAGNYRTRDGLPPGTYYVRTNNSQGFLNELGGGIVCAPSCTVTSSTPIVVTTTGDVAGPNFDLAPGGRVSGVLRSSAPGNPPIGGATVNIVNAAGIVQASGFTSANGAYTTDAGILTGTDYRVTTANQTGMINRVYPSTPCEGTICNAALGTPISVTAGAVPTNVDVTLDPGGRFTGFILSGGAPIAGAGVNVLNASGLTISFGNADAVGKYLTTTGLQTGSYKIRTTNNLGFVNELYDNIECGPSCNLAAGAAVGTTAGSPPAGPVSFDLAQGGRVSGTVTDIGLTPLIGVSVQVFNPTNGTTTSGITDGAGVYSIGGLAPGTYYARTSNSIGYINEAYDGGAGIPCVFTCNSLTLGAPLVIAGATDLAGIDFALDAGARIGGFIQEDGGLPLQGISVSIVDAGGLTQSSGVTDAFGNYLSTVGLRPGTYYVRTSNSLGFLNEVYDNLPCTIPCALTGALGVTVSGSGTFGPINFGLTKGGRVTGTVVDATTLLPLQNVNVAIADASGRVIASGNSDATGTFISGAGLPTGTYYARTNNSQGYQDEIFNNVKCPSSCSVIAGLSFGVTSGATTSGINFALDKGGRVSGVVTNDSLEPLASVTVQIYDSTGKFYTSGFTNSFGIYTSSAGVPAGTYYARTQNGIGYINELFGGTQCLGNCLVTSGTSFLVAGTGTTTGVDFQLTEGGRISGVITDGVTPLTAIGVSIFDSTGAFVTGASTNGIGSYTSTSGLPAGNYFVRTSNNKGYINRLWNVGDCLGCDVTTGTVVPVVLGSTTGGINFTLTAGGRIAGTITRSDTLAGVPGAFATVHDASGVRVATGFTDASGNYITNEGLPDATYFVRTDNSAGLVNQIHLGIPCSASCDPTTGTGVPTTAPTTTTGINFVLSPDADTDADGIVNTIDLSLVFSNDFSDVAQGGTTDGTIVSRGGFTASVGDIIGGVQISLSGAGTSADFDVCSTGGLERLTLDVAGEAATIACQPVTGTTFARALIASPTIELRDPPTGGGTIAVLTTGQAVSLGSPVTADPTNDEAILVKIVDAAGVQIGSFSLDPGESAEAIVSPAGAVDATVVVGTVTVTVRGEDVTLDSGESFDFPPPIFTFTGFFSPVKNPPNVNDATGGSTVPMKFSLGSDAGLEIFAAGFPQSRTVNCSTGVPTGATEPTVGTLQYDPVTGRYTYHWKTQKAWAGTCRQLTMTFADSASTSATVRYKFK
jgi:hypothetical protein